MRLYLCLAAGLIAFLSASPARAQGAPDPLRLVPAEADLCAKLEQPRQLVETVLHSDIVKELLNIESVREQYDSTNTRRFNQLVAYFEKQLGLDRYELLERLTGGGAVFAVKFGPNPAPTLLVIQGRDDKLLERFTRLALEVIEQELNRQDAKDKIERGSYRKIATLRFGKETHVAVAGSVLLVSNVGKMLERGIDLYLDGDAGSLARLSTVTSARKLLDPAPVAWSWLNLETLHKAPQARDIFTLKRNDSQLTVVFGGWLDIAARSPFLCAGLYPIERGFVASVRMPQGREGFPKALAAHLPLPGEPGSRPLLEPPGVLFSASFYLDASQFWEHRKELFNDKQLKGLEDFDKKTALFLAGARLSQLLAQAGPYQRVVIVAQPPRSGLNVKSAENVKAVLTRNVPPFAFVLEMREPEAFFKRLDTILRSAAFLLTTQVKLKLVEEKYKEHKIIAYRFAEDAHLKELPLSYRYDFSPCFTRVGNQFVACYNLSLCRQLVDLLDQETKASADRGSAATLRERVYAAGIAELLGAFKDRLYTQTMLGQALSPQEAADQVGIFMDWVRRLGALHIETNYGARDFRYDIRFERPRVRTKEVTSR